MPKCSAPVPLRLISGAPLRRELEMPRGAISRKDCARSVTVSQSVHALNVPERDSRQSRARFNVRRLESPVQMPGLAAAEIAHTPWEHG